MQNNELFLPLSEEEPHYGHPGISDSNNALVFVCERRLVYVHYTSIPAVIPITDCLIYIHM